MVTINSITVDQQTHFYNHTVSASDVFQTTPYVAGSRMYTGTWALRTQISQHSFANKLQRVTIGYTYNGQACTQTALMWFGQNKCLTFSGIGKL